MKFNFQLFSGLVRRAYENVAGDGFTYSYDDVCSVFRYYFERYEEYTGKAHPPVRLAQIEKLIALMPYADNSNFNESILDIEPEDYEVLIDKYFETEFPNSDRNINHFFSGSIRELRFFEELY